MDFCKLLRALRAGVVVIVAGGTPCRAVDYQPFDWVPAPAGAGILMGYYQFATHSELTNTITGAVKDSHLDSKQLEWAHMRHEEVAAFAAGAETYLTGRLAV